MKVIDLLNKIANGEELPKKIKVYSEWYKEDVIYFLSNTDFSWQGYYFLEKDDTDYALFENNSIGLNDEIEVIEEADEDERINNIDKAIKFIKRNCILSDCWKEIDFGNFVPIGKIKYKSLSSKKVKELLDILKGEDKE